MSYETISTVKLAALGRPFKLGMLYDFRTDKLIPNISFLNSDLSPENINCQLLSWSKCELFITDTFSEKNDLLGIDNNLKLSILANLVELNGSAKLVDDRKKSKYTLRFILKYSVTKDIRALKMTSIDKNYKRFREILDQQIATHVITDILYGGEIFFIFDRTLSDSKHSADIENSIKLLLKKFESFEILENGTLNWKDYEKKLADTLKCQYYGDFQIESNPKTFEDTVKIYKQLTSLIRQNNYNAIPKKVWIHPLYLFDEYRLGIKNFCEMNNDIINSSIRFFDELYNLEVTINDFKNSFSYMEMFYRAEQQFLVHLTRLSEIEVYLRNQILQLVPKIRGGSIKEIALFDLMKNFDISSPNKKRLDNWIKSREEEISIFESFRNQLKEHHNIHCLKSSFLEAQKYFKAEHVLGLIFHLTEKDDSFLNEVFQYSNITIKSSIRQDAKNDQWFNENNVRTIQDKLDLFIEFVQRNSAKPNTQFVTNEEYADNFQMNKGISFILYQNGIPSDFEIPTEPGKPFAMHVTDNSLTLSWSKPSNGSQSIEKYNIYYKSNYNNKWKLLLTTKDNSLSAYIPNLRNGNYQFKLQGITLVGDTAESTSSDIIGLKQTISPIQKTISKPAPIVTTNEINDEKTTLDIVPAWFESVKPVPKKNIRFPAKYKQNSPKDVRTYECLATYRSMIKKTDTVDFVKEPFVPTADSTETLIVILSELADQLSARLTFTNADFTYTDSAYRTACGVTNLGSIHSLVASDGHYETAKFNLHLDFNYEDITQSPITLKNFVLTLINDMCPIAKCNKDFIRVFSVERASSVNVEIGITTPERNTTIEIAKATKQTLINISRGKRSTLEEDTPIDIAEDQVSITFQKLLPDNYDYKMEPAVAFLQLQQSDLDPRFNRDYKYNDEEIRGGHPYYFPKGWYRHALNVDNKYPEDKNWLSMENRPGEWAVAYHGTILNSVKGIKDSGLLHRFVTADLMKNEAKLQNPSIPDVKGLYVATHCENGASDYSLPYEISDAKGIRKTYKVVFQCRVKPGMFTVHKSPVRVGEAWRVFDEKAVRPYGILLKTL